MHRTIGRNTLGLAICGLGLIQGVAVGNAFAEDYPAEIVRIVGPVSEVPMESVWSASTLLRASVYNEKVQPIGTIDDVILGADGIPSVAIIDVGGFLGDGIRRVAVPVSRLHHGSFMIIRPGATRENLRALPDLAYGR